jgi:hypothetical protein
MRGKVGILAAVLLAAAPVRALAEPTTLGFQAGWWSAEAELRTGAGPFFSAGVPWVLVYLDTTDGGFESTIPFDAKAGWEFGLSRGWSFRTGARVAGSRWTGDPCGTGCNETETRAAGFLEGGFRYEAPDGFVAGLDVPVLVTPAFGRSPWVGPLFSRIWLGWAFDL